MINNGNIKVKTFFGTGNNKIEASVNEWLQNNIGIEILEFKYQHAAQYQHHSICVLYKEVTEE